MTIRRQLFLLRHAKSDWAEAGLDDFDRPLAERGIRAARAMATYLAAQRIRPAFALVSASLRTRQTWDLIEPVLEGVPVSFEDCVYEATRGELAKRLRQVDDHIASVLLVGHNPGIGRLAECLCAGHGAPEALTLMAEKYPTGTLAEISLRLDNWRALEDGTGFLERFIRPRDL